MPNGRSGGFVITTADLKELVRGVSDNAVVGQMVVHSLPFRAANAAEITRFVEECPHDRVAVEEQAHKSYIIHLSDEPKPIWLLVGSESPIFLEIRQRHAQWMTEHPDWQGWKAF
jgi:hypothetical protein